MRPRKTLGRHNIIGRHIIAYRMRAKLSQKDFLTKLQISGLDISPSCLSEIERQERCVRDYEIVAIARAMSISTDELLNLSGESDVSNDAS